MTDWARVPVPLSPPTMLALMRAEWAETREALARQRAVEEAAEARREQAEAQLRAYVSEHGEYPWETRQREAEAAARAEAREQEKAEQAREEARQAFYAAQIAAGRRPRSIGEVLADAALYP